MGVFLLLNKNKGGHIVKKKCKDIGEIKLKASQHEVTNIVSEFRTALNKHFEIVYAKSKHLIDSRWGVVNSE